MFSCHVTVAMLVFLTNRPLATNGHMVQNLPCWRASLLLFQHWDVKTKRPEPVKLDLPLFECPSVGIIMSLPSSMADFVPYDRLLQKAYWHANVFFCFGGKTRSLITCVNTLYKELSPNCPGEVPS